MRILKFRVPNQCQNGHFRWLYSVFTNGFENRTEWGSKHPDCKCPTHEIGEGFKPCGDVQQFTGLSDKSGVEIFEGDIVQLRFLSGLFPESFENGSIQWHEKSSGFKWISGDNDTDWNHHWLSQADDKFREVIGNIYENEPLDVAERN